MSSCELHVFHRPKPLTDETHHIIPQAWQVYWAPPPVISVLFGSSSIPIGAPKSKLWDPRTAELCPTGHRNVHYWLVAYMKGEAAGTYSRTSARSKEQKMARLAMDRWEEAGGSLKLLWDAKLWGSA